MLKLGLVKWRRKERLIRANDLTSAIDGFEW
jgi:hypothetical protein